MKLKLDFKNKKADIEANVERIVEKGMEYQEKDWKDKFDTKHNAKKEMLELKHKQRLEMEDRNGKKKNWLQKIQEEKRKNKELELQMELEEKRRQEEENRRLKEESEKLIKKKKGITILLAVIGSLFIIVGYPMGFAGEGLLVVGFLALVSIPFLWRKEKDVKPNKKQKKKMKKNKN